jgi:tRNA pseudouridine13 synthase
VVDFPILKNCAALGLRRGPSCRGWIAIKLTFLGFFTPPNLVVGGLPRLSSQFLMKLKCLPDDFIVDEEIDLPNTPGPYSVYKLTKWSTGTIEAVDDILHRWNIPRAQLSYAGLKDKHACTSQFVTIRNGPRQGLQHERMKFEYLGPTNRPVGPKDIVANRFTIVLRDMTQPQLELARQAAEEIATHGLPNYFDEQRFGSLGEEREFIGRPWCLGDWERTLWLVLADHNSHDRPDERDQKRLLRNHWGDWLKCKEILARSHRRSIITYLCDKPTDFKGALARVRQDLRGIYLAAFQSDLWNGMLDQLLTSTCAAERLVRLPLGRRQLAFYRQLTDEERQLMSRQKLPLPSARLHDVPEDILKLITGVLEPEGLELRQLRVKYPRDSFFSKGERATLLFPEGLKSYSGGDELYDGQRKLTLAFTLPRGSYATMIVKRLTAVAGSDLSAAMLEENEETESSAPGESPGAAAT